MPELMNNLVPVTAAVTENPAATPPPQPSRKRRRQSCFQRRNLIARKHAADFQLDLQRGTLDLGPGLKASSSNKSPQSSNPGSDEEEEGDKKKPHARGVKQADLLQAPMANPVSAEPRRIQIDIEQAQALVHKLDSEKRIKYNILGRSDKMGRDKSHGSSSGPIILIRGLTSVKGLDGIELLDTLLTYLWRIHGVDYYGMSETNKVKGLRHVRFDGENPNVILNGCEWENKLDSCWQERLKSPHPLEMTYIRKIEDETYGWTYGCGAKGCTELFHAVEFVQEHLRLKHPDLLVEITAATRSPAAPPPPSQPSLKQKKEPKYTRLSRYHKYKSECIATQKKAYFNAHKDEEWLKDKYHPANLVSLRKRRNKVARKQAKDFQLDLQSGTLDLGPGVTASSSNKSRQSSNPGSDEEEEGDRKKRRAKGVKQADLLQAPMANPVSAEPRRIQIDIEQAQALVHKLDSEKRIKYNILGRSDKMGRDKSHGSSSGPIILIRGLTSVKGLEGTELLDTLLTYLWRIHGVDYYGMSETNEAKGLRHVSFDSENPNVTLNGCDWENKLDSCWQERLKSPHPLEIMIAKEKIDAAATEALDTYVRKIEDETYGWTYGCGAKGCTELFHALEFVHEHLRLKHPDLVVEITAIVCEDLYFQNYMNDENAPGGTPTLLREAMFDSFEWQGNSCGNFPSDTPPPFLTPLQRSGPLRPLVPAPRKVAMQSILLHWIVPVRGRYKLNTDGAVVGTKSSCGGLVRDEHGQLVVSFGRYFGKTSASTFESIISSELQGMLSGLELCKRCQLHQIELESDSRDAIRLIYTGRRNSSKMQVINDIRALVEELDVTFNHVYRECNRAADLLANKAFRLRGDFSMSSSCCSPDLRDIVRRDMESAFLRWC